MLAARAALGLSQAAAAEAAGVGFHQYRALERFDYAWRDAAQCAAAVAGFLALPLEQVMPEDMAGRALDSDRTVISECPQLAELARHCGRLLPAPADTVEMQDRDKQVRAGLLRLTTRQRQVMELLYGFDGAPGRTRETVGRILGISRSRVRQLECAALWLLQDNRTLQSVASPADRRGGGFVVAAATDADATQPRRRRCRPLSQPPRE